MKHRGLYSPKGVPMKPLKPADLPKIALDDLGREQCFVCGNSVFTPGSVIYRIPETYRFMFGDKRFGHQEKYWFCTNCGTPHRLNEEGGLLDILPTFILAKAAEYPFVEFVALLTTTWTVNKVVFNPQAPPAEEAPSEGEQSQSESHSE